MSDHDAEVETRKPAVGSLRAVARPDPITERLRQHILQLMKAHNHMEQQELARRAKQPKFRVHKFVKGQMPYPPLTFLNDLFSVFGYTLAEALVAAGMLPVKPPTRPSISIPIVLEIAETLEQYDDDYLKTIRDLVRARQKRRSR